MSEQGTPRGPSLRRLILTAANAVDNCTGGDFGGEVVARTVLQDRQICTAITRIARVAGPQHARRYVAYINRTMGDVLRKEPIVIVNGRGETIRIRRWLAHRDGRQTRWVSFYRHTASQYSSVLATGEAHVNAVQANLRPVRIAEQLLLPLGDDLQAGAIRDDIEQVLGDEAV